MWNVQMIRDDVAGYTDRFNELAILVPHMVTPKHKRVERYLWGLASQICSMVISSNHVDAKNAIALAFKLRDDAIRNGLFAMEEVEQKEVGEKWKWFGKNVKKKYQRLATVKTFAAKTVEPKGYEGTKPKCNECGYHHGGK
ncbi:hypothetical protein L1987_68848 [Smallanthus sonchifolius]|uniref:Uncharacterized protein n=1 Tax=Smallanthus sonchifolius TaxID=185202 RepID=A0ACB9B514_9ASTR|nr:hypothetical protein L1987_68848 [Smallanthus sonchifolius]